MAEESTATVLPFDVVQIVLGYLTDSRSVAAARLACKSWRQAAAAAPCAVRVVLPSGAPNMRDKLAMLLRLMPGLSGVHASVAAGSDPAYTSACLQDLQAFQNLRQLELSFADSQELSAADIVQLASLKSLTTLRLSNVSLSAAADSSPLTALQGLQELSLVHHSKVSALMVGDSHLQVLGKLAGLRSLVLQGRMCSATDEGLLALSGLGCLSSLSISWVPWQSQITQPAALQLLASLTQLKSLQLGGAELLLPSTPYHPVSAVPAPSPAGAPAHHAAMQHMGHMGPQQGLIAAAVAAVAGGARADAAAVPAMTAGSSTGGAAAAAAGSTASQAQGEQMRNVLAAKSSDLQEFKLQFNCCGTGVEKALVSLGEVRRKLTGLQWSYAKLSGPSSVNLLASCTNLRSLKLRLWYQDYNLTPFDFNLTDLSQLGQLRTLVIDKRPPFQQQLPAQQSAISMPITSGMLTKLARCWPHLEKLQLGLARSDFGHTGPLEGLAGFSQLRSLSVHCYDQGYDDGHFMLPINVAGLPSSLVKLDLMHAELFNSNGSSSSSQGLVRSNSGSGRGGSSYLMSSSSISGLKSYSSIGDGRGSRSVSAGGACGCSSSSSSCGGTAITRPMARSDGGSSSRGMSFGASGGFTSMLSESFSMLSRQASAECSAAYLSALMAQREEQKSPSNNGSSSSSQTGACASSSSAAASSSVAAAAAGAASTGSSAGKSGTTSSAAAAAGTSAAAAASASLAPSFLLARGGSGLTEPNHSGWLQELLNDNSSSSSRPGAGDAQGSSSSSALPRQPSLPPLPRQQSLSAAAPGHIPPPKRSNSAAAQQALGCGLMGRHAGKSSLLLPAERQIGSAAAGSGASIGVPQSPAVPAAMQQQQAGGRSRLQNPFAAAAAAAAVHAEVGGCVAAVDPHMAEAAAAASASAVSSSSTAGAQPRSLTTSSSAFAKVQEDAANSNTGSISRSSSGGLGMSFSLGFARSFSKGSSSKAAAAAEAAAVAAWEAANSCGCCEWEAPPGLPLLQHLQLKHCALDGIGLEDVITTPGELRSLQLVEVVGLSPRDIALMPCLAALLRLTLIAAKEDAWLGLAPLRLLSKLPELRHLDWVVSERALPARSKATDLQALLQFRKLQVITLHTVLGKCEQLHTVSGQLHGGCHVRLMAPAYCEHASRRTGSKISRLLGAASCLILGTGC